jgi:hypothetical protein
MLRLLICAIFHRNNHRIGAVQSPHHALATAASMASMASMEGSMSSTEDRYLGVLELLPELSLYAYGPLPISGIYRIEASAQGIRFRITWKMQADGPEQATEFGGPADGVRQPLPQGGAGPDSFTITRVDAATLDSAAWRGDQVIAYARRAVSADGSLMAVVQEGMLPDGQRFRNFQVYRRQTA